MNKKLTKRLFFDSNFPAEEQLPRIYDVCFKEVSKDSNKKVVITIGNQQIGGLLTDNSYKDDGYRYHDVFHFSYAAILGWSPCVRKMLGKKRKSNLKTDEVEDGARAIITEEAISLLIYNFAKENDYYQDTTKIDSHLLEIILKLASDFEVQKCSKLDWEKAISMGYSAFRSLNKNKGGVVRVNMLNSNLSYLQV